MDRAFYDEKILKGFPAKRKPQQRPVVILRYKSQSSVKNITKQLIINIFAHWQSNASSEKVK